VYEAPAFCGYPIDRASLKRREAESLFDASAAEMIVLREGQPLLTPPGADGLMRPVRLTTGARNQLFGAGALTIFLGIDADDAPVFAVDAGRANPTADGELLEGMGTFEELRAAAMRGVPDGDLALIGTAKSILDWHARHGFCAVCGARTAATEGGWKRVCSSCNAEHFPRFDPVVIMLAIRDGKCLVGRQPRFPPGMYSALAGFIEPGETIEEACARELGEEAGLFTRSVRYVGTQPWPWPSQMMIGLFAEVEDGPVNLDPEELEHAVWLTKEQAAAALSGGASLDDGSRVWAPPRLAIASALLKAWSEE
jgi:NAD+ diphosphatase